MVRTGLAEGYYPVDVAIGAAWGNKVAVWGVDVIRFFRNLIPVLMRTKTRRTTDCGVDALAKYGRDGHGQHAASYFMEST